MVRFGFRVSCVSASRFSFLFFFFFLAVNVDFSLEQCTCSLFTGPTNITFLQLFIKNRSHGTIHTFKNYFAIVFLIFSFQLYPNRPNITQESLMRTYRSGIRAALLEHHYFGDRRSGIIQIRKQE